MVKDVVCGMEVDHTDDRTLCREFSGKKYYFCSVECKLMFGRDPLLFIRQGNKSREPVVDVVCGMETDKENALFTLNYHGQWYYFCSQSCLQEFERNPQRYASEESRK